MTPPSADLAPDLLEVAVSDRLAERALLERITGSRHFAKSALLCGFLRHICESHFAGRENELTEQQIGVRVFGRAAGYDCGADNIVRNYARQLRQRLDDYYHREGQAEPLRLEMPRGGYRPVFVEALPHPVPESPTIPPPDPAADPEGQSAPTPAMAIGGHEPGSRPALAGISLAALPAAWIVVAALTLALISAALVIAPSSRRASAEPLPPMDSLWSALFRSDHNTVIVTADSGFGTLQDMLGRRLSLEDYMELRLGTFAPEDRDPYVTRDMASQRYTSMSDLETSVALSHLPEVVPSRLTIRFARDLRMDDLKDNDVILLGSAYTNPWSALFDRYLNFQLQGDVRTHTWQFVNVHPGQGEPSIYAGERDGTSHRTYALAALLPNLNHSGHVLLLEGLDMAGTQAAAEALLHSSALEPAWARTRQCATADAAFEVLLGTTSIGANAGTVQVLASRIHCGK